VGKAIAVVGGFLQRQARPARVVDLCTRALPFLAALTVAFLAVGLTYALVLSPPDYQQGESVRIMYVHVPAAWMGLFVYALVAALGAVGLIGGHPLAFLAARAAAPLGAGFTAVCLITGSLWGKPMWGAWWVWDARLTSMLLLLFLYFGHGALSQAFDDQRRGDKAAAVLALVGCVNLPIIKFSVDWWNTLHQPASIFKMGGPAVDPSMLVPLLLMMGAFKGLFFTLWLLRVRSSVVAARVRAQASRGGPWR